MPIYNFVCNNHLCHNRFEELCSWDKSDTIKCPTCGTSATKQLSGIKRVIHKGVSHGTNGGHGSGPKSSG